jgi:hypothetical protein
LSTLGCTNKPSVLPLTGRPGEQVTVEKDANLDSQRSFEVFIGSRTELGKRGKIVFDDRHLHVFIPTETDNSFKLARKQFYPIPEKAPSSIRTENVYSQQTIVILRSDKFEDPEDELILTSLTREDYLNLLQALRLKIVQARHGGI